MEVRKLVSLKDVEVEPEQPEAAKREEDGFLKRSPLPCITSHTAVTPHGG